MSSTSRATNWTPTHRVIRALPGDGLEIGDVVDGSTWRNTEKLVQQRYLQPLSEQDALAEIARRRAAQTPDKPPTPEK